MSGTLKETKPQLLHLVFGGEVETPDSHTFTDVENSTSWAFFQAMPKLRMRGVPKPRRPSTTPICAISSSTCTGSWNLVTSTRTREIAERSLSAL
jgi:hypothetical protein